MIVAIKCNKVLSCGFGASLFFLLFLSVPVTLFGEEQGTIVVSGGTLIDGNGGPPLQNAIVVIQDGKFSQVGRVGEVTVPADSRVIDASGKTILPGFVDGHVHYRTWHGELYLANGVTTIVDLGNADEWMLALIHARERGLIRTPRIFASGARFGAPLSIRREKLFRYVASHKHHFLFVDVEEVKRRIREKKKKGLSVIKVDETWRKEDLQEIAQAAHAEGMSIVGHATDPRDAANAGQDAIMHLYSIIVGTITDPAKLDALYKREVDDIYSLMDPTAFPDLIQLLVSKNVALNVMPSSHFWVKNEELYAQEDARLFRLPGLQYIPLVARVNVARNHGKIQLMSASERASFKNHYLRFVREFSEAGGKIILGTDTVAFHLPGVGARRDLLALHEAGIDAMTVIQAATKNPAELYRLQDIGTVEPGKWGDLQIIDGNPLENLEDLKNIETVIIGGEIIDTGFHAGYNNLFDRPYPEDIGPGLPPILRSIGPKSVSQGSADLELTVTGARFDQYTNVLFGGTRLATTTINSNTLKAVVPARLLQSLGTFPVSLDDPRLLGEDSAYYGFIVDFE